MKPKILCLLAVLACLTGCVPVDSLNPLYTDGDLISDDALVGRWMPIDHSQEPIVFQFEKSQGPSYILQVSTKNKSDKLFYVVRLVGIGKNRFLDVSPTGEMNISILQNPRQALQLMSGKNLERPLFHLGLGTYFELAGNTQNEANVKTAHWLFKFHLEGKKLSLDGTDDEKFLQAMDANKFHLDTALERGRDVLITASTKDLQKFVIEHLDDGSLFTQHVPEMERMPSQ